MSRPWQSEERLREMYCEKGMSIRDIASELDCNYCTVRKWMQRHKIERRDRTGYDEKPWQHEEKLRELYWEQGLSTEEMADKWGCTDVCVLKNMQRCGVERRGVGGSNPLTFEEYHDDWRVGSDEELFRILHHQHRKRKEQIADLLDVSCGVVRDRFEQYGIDDRDDEITPRGKEYRDPDVLRYLHHERGYTQKEIADYFDVSVSTIKDLFFKVDIDRNWDLVSFDRSPMESRMRSRVDDKPWHNRTVLKKHYIDEGKTIEQVADTLGCGSTTVTRWLERYGLKEPSSAGLSFRTNETGRERFRHRYTGKQDVLLHHRLYAVALYGYDEVKGKEVHHPNRIPWDNREKNIELLTPEEHTITHMRESSCD